MRVPGSGPVAVFFQFNELDFQTLILSLKLMQSDAHPSMWFCCDELYMLYDAIDGCIMMVVYRVDPYHTCTIQYIFQVPTVQVWELSYGCCWAIDTVTVYSPNFNPWCDPC